MIRGLWSQLNVGLMLAISLIPVVLALILDQGAEIVPRMVICLLVVTAWQVVFRLRLGVAFAPAGLVTAVAVGALAPIGAPLWQLMLGVSFGVVIGELIFGGWGRNFLSASVVALAFLSLSLPAADYPVFDTNVGWALIPAAAILVLTGLVALPILLAAAAVFAAAAYGLETGVPPVATLAFVALYLTADPVASAATPMGRWIYGALAGGLAALMIGGPASAVQAAVFATLLAQIFAPLIDQGVIAVDVHRRKARNG